MKQYLLNEETWKLFMLALNKAPYELVVPVVEKIRTEVKLVLPKNENPNEVINEPKTEMA